MKMILNGKCMYFFCFLVMLATKTAGNMEYEWLIETNVADNYDFHFGFTTCSLGRVPDRLHEEMVNAWESDCILEYVMEHKSDYYKLSDKEIEWHILMDRKGVLACCYMDNKDKETEWFYFPGNEYVIVRRSEGDNQYLYFKFIKTVEGDGYELALSALGRNEEYYFMEVDGEDYLVLTKREAGTQKLIGTATYCMFADPFIGWVLYQEKDFNGEILEEGYSYTTIGSSGIGLDMPWPDYEVDSDN